MKNPTKRPKKSQKPKKRKRVLGISRQELTQHPQAHNHTSILIAFLLITLSFFQHQLVFGQVGINHYQPTATLMGDFLFISYCSKILDIVLVIPVCLILQKLKGRMAAIFLLLVLLFMTISNLFFIAINNTIICYFSMFFRALAKGSVAIYPAIRSRRFFHPFAKNMITSLLLLCMSTLSYESKALGNMFFKLVDGMKEDLDMIIYGCVVAYFLLGMIGSVILIAVDSEVRGRAGSMNLTEQVEEEAERAQNYDSLQELGESIRKQRKRSAEERKKEEERLLTLGTEEMMSQYQKHAAEEGVDPKDYFLSEKMAPKTSLIVRQKIDLN